ncbi:MAG: ATP-binding protein [Hespellia sp.]|nr:ATP-binding protein [Hespellia sp.]
MEVVIRDIPRIYTALAEWSACLITIIMFRKRLQGVKLYLTAAVMLVVQVAFMDLTKALNSNVMWILCMAGAVALMFTFIFICCKVKVVDAIYCCARDFILAEFMASFEWQIYCFFWPAAEAPVWVRGLLLLVTYGGICLIMYRLDRLHLSERDTLNVEIKEVVSVVVIVVIIFIISNLSFVSANTPFSGMYNEEIMNIRTIVDFGGLAILYAYFVQCSEFRTRTELEAMQNVFKNQYQQYQQSKESIDIINRKYHDFKHQIAALRAETDIEKKNAYLDEMEQDIKDYEAQNKTGNQVLDTLLTSKSLYCSRKHISLTNVVDGKLLDFIYTMDLCSIFGNALDNAIECEQKIKDRAKRLIHVSVSAQKGFVLICVENYCEEPVVFKDGLPVTSKMDKSMHGYGMKSMRHATQKYGGTLTASQSNNWFELKILIPIPEETEVK